MRRIGAMFLATAALAAQAPRPPKAPAAPDLRPGEAFALAGPDGVVQAWGASRVERPLGVLGCLPWLRLEGDGWAARDVQFKCKGPDCTRAKGHGRVDLPEALQAGCRAALLAWIAESAEQWRQDYGEGVARARLEEAFRPFLGPRLARGEGLPDFAPVWIGEGDLLRATPDALLAWLADPAQSEMVSRCRRLFGSMAFHFRDLAGAEDWWTLAGPESPQGGAWAVGGNGRALALLHVPAPAGGAEARARFRALLGIRGR